MLCGNGIAMGVFLFRNVFVVAEQLAIEADEDEDDEIEGDDEEEEEEEEGTDDGDVEGI
jgi:hypothetical protein